MNNIFQIGRRHDTLTESHPQQPNVSLQTDAVLEPVQHISQISQAEARKSLAFPMEKMVHQLPDHYDGWKILGGASMREVDRIDVLSDASGRKIVLVGGGYTPHDAVSMQCEALSIVSIAWHANTIHELITIAAGGHYNAGVRSNGGLRGMFAFVPDRAVRSQKFLSTREYSQVGAALVASPRPTRRGRTAAFLQRQIADGRMTPEAALSAIMAAPETVQFPASLIDVRNPEHRNILDAGADSALVRHLKKTLYRGTPGDANTITHISVSDIIVRYLNQLSNPAEFVSANRNFLRELADAETKRSDQAEFLRNRKLYRQIPMRKGEYYSEHYAALHEKVIMLLSDLISTPFDSNLKVESIYLKVRV